LISTAAGEERAFAAISYFSHALHHFLGSAPGIAIQTRLGLLARLRNHSEKAFTATPTTPSPSSSPSRLLALSSLFSETRYTLRLFGLVPLWTWGSQTLKSPPSDRIIYSLTLLQIVANVLYQALENVGYLASKNIVSKRFVERWGGIDKLYLWSTRAWFGHIVLQFVVLWRQHVLRKAKAALMSQEKKDELLAGEVRAWKKSLVNSLFWAPLALHWSFENGIGIPGSVTGAGGFMAGAWGFWDLWASTLN